MSWTKPLAKLVFRMRQGTFTPDDTLRAFLNVNYVFWSFKCLKTHLAKRLSVSIEEIPHVNAEKIIEEYYAFCNALQRIRMEQPELRVYMSELSWTSISPHFQRCRDQGRFTKQLSVRHKLE